MKRTSKASIVMAIFCLSFSAANAANNFTAASSDDQPKIRSFNGSVPSIVRQEASRAGVPVSFALAIANHESSFNCKAHGAAGERGVMQIKPATARGIGYTGSASGLNVCQVGVFWGMKYLKMALTLAKGDRKRAAFLYNAGLGAKSRNPSSRPYVVALFRKKVLTE